MFHDDDAFRRVTLSCVLMIMTSQPRLDKYQFEANKLYLSKNRLIFEFTDHLSYQALRRWH